MAIQEGDTLPAATFVRVGADGPEEVELGSLTRGRKVVIFAVPGAFTPTCHSAHVPSFVRTRDGFAEKGIDAIYCVAVNDPFVLDAWAEDTGAKAAGIAMLGDPECRFTAEIGMEFDAPPVGLIRRSKRYAMVVEDNRVVSFHPETARGTCEVSGGEALLATL